MVLAPCFSRGGEASPGIEFRVALDHGSSGGLQRTSKGKCEVCNKIHDINKEEDRRTLEDGGVVKIAGRRSKNGPASTVRWRNFIKKA